MTRHVDDPMRSLPGQVLENLVGTRPRRVEQDLVPGLAGPRRRTLVIEQVGHAERHVTKAVEHRVGRGALDQTVLALYPHDLGRMACHRQREVTEATEQVEY